MSPAPAEAPIKAVILDVDGTLLTTGGAGAVAWDKAFREVFGKSVDIAKVTESGMTDHDVAFAALGAPTPALGRGRADHGCTGPGLATASRS